MTIDIETFEATPAEELRDLSNPDRVLRFLVANDDQAFTAVEIAERTGAAKNSISAVLSRLEERELVRHKGDYWAVGDAERLRLFGQYRRATERLNDRYGSEDANAWREHAPEKPHPNVDEE